MSGSWFPFVIPLGECLYGLAQTCPRYYAGYANKEEPPQARAIRAIIKETFQRLAERKQYQAEIQALIHELPDPGSQEKDLDRFIQQGVKIIREPSTLSCFITGTDWGKKEQYYFGFSCSQPSPFSIAKALYPLLEDSISEERFRVVAATLALSCFFKCVLGCKKTSSFAAVLIAWGALRLVLAHQREVRARRFAARIHK